MIPLRLHSEFSLLKAMVPVHAYPAALKEAGYAGAAITDLDCGFGWIDFFSKMKEAGLKPILGTSLQLSLHEDSKLTGTVTFLVINEQGYQNLCKNLSAYSLKKLTLSMLVERQEGLYCLISPDHPGLSKPEAWIKDWHKDRLFFEVQRYHGAPDEAHALQAAALYQARCVATQPTFYLKPEDHKAFDVLLNIGAGTTILDEQRVALPSKDLFFKTPEYFKKVFSDHPEWLEASEEILKAVDFKFKTDVYHIPAFGDNDTLEARFDKACEDGLNERLELIKSLVTPEQYHASEPIYRERLKLEREVIKRMQFCGYFLIVSDFINWSKNNGVPVGPGRGSGAGSLAAYALKITDIDPIPYNLLFERFLNPERVSMPDFDVDFCVKGRDRVIHYVREKYNLHGIESPEEALKVSQIITFGKMKSKAVIRDVGRALGMPYSDVDAVAKLVPNVLNITLKEAFEMEPEFEALRSRDSKVDELLTIAESLEGLSRHSSVHAAGVVIADDVLTKYLPLYQGSDQEIVSQFEMKGVEKIGLLKFDFLGLRNLTVIQECIDLVKKYYPSAEPIHLLKINMNDPHIMAEVASGDTTGLFQLESSGMRDVIRRFKPTCFEDIVAIVALYRPGPLEGGMVDDFIARKHGQRPVTYMASVLEPILKETYGVFVYQEQVMKTANVMAGFSLGEADMLRRAMGKKIASEMAQQREKFVKGAVANGHPENAAQNIFDLMSEFAKYGFNKSHAAAYAMITVQTAYLRHYYPEAFYSALLSSESDDVEKVGVIIRSAVKRGIPVLPPDVQTSEASFAIEKKENKDCIRFGLEAIKNLGATTAAAIVAHRNDKGLYKDIQDVFTRLHHDQFNKRQAEALVRSGALDCFGHHRASIFASLDGILGTSAATGRDRALGQKNLFAAKPKLKEIEEWPDRLRLNDEKHLLGTYMTGHPLQGYQALLQSFDVYSLHELHQMPAPAPTHHGERVDYSSRNNNEISVAGLVVTSKEIFNKKGQKMAFVTIEDREASMELVVFSDLFAKRGDLLVAGRVLLVKGQISRESETTKILARELSDLSQIVFKELRIQLKDKSQISELGALAESVARYPGSIKVQVQIPSEVDVGGSRLKKSYVTIETPFLVQTHPQLMSWLEQKFGEGALRLQ